MATSNTANPCAPLISVVIPVFNQWRYTAACLESLQRTIPDDTPTEIILVDNASTDETASGLTEWCRRWNALRVERLPTNTGFSPACNRGAELARGEYLIFLNNDTEPQPGWLPPLLTAVRRTGVGIVAPKLVYPNSATINHAGYVFSQGKFYGIYHERPSDLPAANRPRAYQALLGACLILRRDLFESLGRFSLEGLEDIDLCLKARERGLAAFYEPSSVVLHHGSVTLSLSPPGSFPITNTTGFGQRWGNYLLSWDDFDWYIQDGEWPSPPGATDVETARRIAGESMQKCIAAAARVNAGDRLGERQLLGEALALWPHNPWAFARLCVTLTDSGERDEAFTHIQRLGEFMFAPFLIEELKPALRVLLPPEAYARICGSVASS